MKEFGRRFIINLKNRDCQQWTLFGVWFVLSGILRQCTLTIVFVSSLGRLKLKYLKVVKHLHIWGGGGGGEPYSYHFTSAKNGEK